MVNPIRDNKFIKTSGENNQEIISNWVKFEIHDLNIWFGSIHAIKQVNMEIQANEILSVIGPSNSGKTTFLRTLNLEMSLCKSSYTNAPTKLSSFTAAYKGVKYVSFSLYFSETLKCNNRRSSKSVLPKTSLFVAAKNR